MFGSVSPFALGDRCAPWGFPMALLIVTWFLKVKLTDETVRASVPAFPVGKRGPRKVNPGLSAGCGNFISMEMKLLLPQVIFPVCLK